MTTIVEVLNAAQGLKQGRTGKSLLNSTVFGTPLEKVYGGNVEGLRNIRVVIDVEDMMGLVQLRASVPEFPTPATILTSEHPRHSLCE